jgi:hypothetical protein
VLRLAVSPVAALDAVGDQEELLDLPFPGMDVPPWVETSETGPHARVEVLVTGIGAAVAGPCAAVAQNQVSVTRFTLGPGEGLSAHQVEGVELLAVNPDGLEVTIPDADPLMTPAASPATGREPLSRSGNGVVFSPPSAPSVRNAGPLSLSLVSVALQPTGGTSCAVAPIDT